MNTSEKMKQLEQEGVVFYKMHDAGTWEARFAGETVAAAYTLGDCIWQAADKLNMNEE